MPITSQWSFASLNRNRSTVLSGSAFLSTSAYSITRFRTSDDTYASQVDDAVQSLSGYNGGVTETITTPAIEGTLGSDIDDPMQKTNDLIREGNLIMSERLGGVLN